MSEKELRNELNQLMAEFTALTPVDRAYVQELFQSKMCTDNGIIEVIYSIEDKLSFIRMCTKYLQLDLEATRRENVFLRRILNETSADGSSF